MVRRAECLKLVVLHMILLWCSPAIVGCTHVVKRTTSSIAPSEHNDRFSQDGNICELVPEQMGIIMVVAAQVRQPPPGLSTGEWEMMLKIIGRIPHVDPHVYRAVGWGGKDGEITAVTVWTGALEIYLIPGSVKHQWRIVRASGYVAD
jgi:hypothetical protein